MLTLDDFLHLPAVARHMAQVLTKPGLVIVTGASPLTARGLASRGQDMLASGRTTVYRLLLRQSVARLPLGGRASVVGLSRQSLRLPHEQAAQVSFAPQRRGRTPAEDISDAVRAHPSLLVLGLLDATNAAAALSAARTGMPVLAQMETPHYGGTVARRLHELGASYEDLRGLATVIAIQRVLTMCAGCKRVVLLDTMRQVALQAQYAQLPLHGPFYQASGCPACGHSGHSGEALAFDVFEAETPAPALFDQPSQLPMAGYVWGLAAQGWVGVHEAERLEADRLDRAYNQLASSEQALAEAHAALQRKAAEIEAAQRVLQQRQQAMQALEELAHWLVQPGELRDLARRVCQQACALCGAERGIVYRVRGAGLGAEAVVLAVLGWAPELVGQHLPVSALVMPEDVPDTPDTAGWAPAGDAMDAMPWPPGVPRRAADVEGVILHTGQRVPLVVHGRTVGVLWINSARRDGLRPGEVALLETFANHAALALQRAELIADLQAKVVQLEAAQSGLLEKARMQHELSLAHQVQKSLLPRTFPRVPGYTFAARSEPARAVGGDFYDVIALEDTLCGIAIGDVSDKGLPAALFMALTRSVLLAESRRGSSPRGVLENVNQLLLELGGASFFVTMFYGVLDATSGLLTYVRAGHDYPLLIHAGHVTALGGEGTVLGFLELGELGLSQECVTLVPGDRLVLYTDGITDALDVQGEAFGLGRLRMVLERQAAGSAEGVCAAILAAVAAHQGRAEAYDDASVLVVAVG